MQKGGSGNVNMPQVGKVGGQGGESKALPDELAVDKTGLENPPDLPDQMLLDWVKGPIQKEAIAEQGASTALQASEEVRQQFFQGLRSAELRLSGGVDQTGATYVGHVADRLGNLLHGPEVSPTKLSELISDTAQKLGLVSKQLNTFLDDHSEQLPPDSKSSTDKLRALFEVFNKHATVILDALKKSDEQVDEDTLKKSRSLHESLLEITTEMRELTVTKSTINLMTDVETTLKDLKNRLNQMAENANKKIKQSPKDAPIATANYIRFVQNSFDKLNLDLDRILKNRLPKPLKAKLENLKGELKKWSLTANDMFQKLKKGSREPMQFIAKNGPEIEKTMNSALETIASQRMLAQALNNI